MLVLALGVHSVFEGIALGLQESAESAGKLAAGILLHKLAAAISLGGSFARTGFNLKIIIISWYGSIITYNSTKYNPLLNFCLVPLSLLLCLFQVTFVRKILV